MGIGKGLEVGVGNNRGNRLGFRVCCWVYGLGYGLNTILAMYLGAADQSLGFCRGIHFSSKSLARATAFTK